MITNQSITVDLMRRNSPIEKIYCKQNDSRSRQVRLSVLENGTPTNITAPARVYYEDYKYRSLCYQDVQITNGVAEFTIVQTALSVSGEVRAELQILNADDDEEILSSATFIIDCDRQVNLSGRAGGDGKDVLETMVEKAVQGAVVNKVDKEEGKGLSSNDYTNTDKELVQSIPNKANTSDVNDALENKVDKIPGKRLSTNDYTNIDKMMVDTISGKANVVTVNQQLAGKVDKADGKGLSTNDFTNEDKTKLDNLENYDDTELRDLVTDKQDKLTAGDNITIDENNVISATGGGGSGAVDDVKVDGVSVVSSGIANIDLSGKANASDVYTKQEVNTRLQTKAPLSDVDILFDTIGNVPETTTVQAEIDSLDTRVTYLEEHGGGGDTTEIYSILRVMKSILKSGVFTSNQQSNFSALESLLPDGVVQDGSNLIVRNGVSVTQSENEITIA